MYKFFQRNQKKLLAVFGVVLMMTFLMPTFRTASQTRSDQIAGTIGSETISRDDVDSAEAEWQFLVRRVMLRTNEPGPNQWKSVILEVPEFRMLGAHLQDNPQGYYLLQYDAKRLGYAPQYDRAEQLLKDPSDSVAIAMPDDRIVPWNQLNDEYLQGMAKQSVADLLMVMGVFERARDAVKVSDPLIKHELASRYQQIKSRVVDFTVLDELHNVPTPLPDDLQKHFQAFASVETGADKGARNPFGFGYKYPDRVKVQYIGIPRTEIRKAVQSQKTDYDWDKDGHMYYLQHQSEFPATTQPAATQSSLALGPTTRSGPSTRPYEDVKQTIMDRLIEPLANRLAQQIQTQITSRLNQDYQSYAKTAGPTSAPTGAAYESFEYLQKLAAEIENRYHVTLTVASVADAFRDRSQLAELPGVGKIVKFPDYAMTAVQPLSNTQAGTIPASIKLFEPSKALVDEEGIGDVYIFRVIATDAAHQPASVDEVKDRVEQDWKKMQAYGLAKADAKKLLEAAREPGLDAASSDRKVITTGFYSTSTMTPIENYRVATTSQAEFVKQTFGLLPILTEKDHARPVTAIEMPADGKVAVAELIAVESGLNAQSLDLAKLLMGDQIAQPYAMSVIQDWFAYDNVVQRLGFKDQAHSKGTE